MRIALLAEILNPHSGARFPIELAYQLAKRHQVHFFAYDRQLDKETLKRLKKRGIKVTLYPYFKPHLLARLAPIPNLTKTIHQGSFDLVLFIGFLPFFIAAKLSGGPVVQTYMGNQTDVWRERFSPDHPLGLLNKLINQLANQIIFFRGKIFFWGSTQSVAISRFTQKEARRLYQVKIPLVSGGVNAPFSQRLQPPKFSKNSCSFLSVSRLTPYKNFHLLIKAFHQVNRVLPQTSLTIAGSAPNPNYLHYLLKLAKGQPKIKILTDVSDQELKVLYQTGQVYLSADRFSFFGLPPLEAALFGLPTIALNFAALPEIVIHQKTGLIAQNQKELISQMRMLAQNPSLAQKLGQNARKWAKKFTWEKAAQKYEAIFSDILEG